MARTRVARALKATQIAWAKANCFEELNTRSDERNVPIRRLGPPAPT